MGPGVGDSGGGGAEVGGVNLKKTRSRSYCDRPSDHLLFCHGRFVVAALIASLSGEAAE